MTAWFFDCAIHVNPDRETHWRFTDSSGDTYSLSCINVATQGWHRLSYNSFEPGIVKIAYTL